MPSIRLLISHSYDPWFNLSLEEYIFKNMPPKQSILFLWRNQNTVVIGRAQNAWRECNTRRMARDGIKLARRNSGGGAVFHDLGNTCFTFMSTCQNYDKNLSTNIIVNGLQQIGITTIISGRNDLIINTKDGQRKISGSAYRESTDRKLHHGTLLLNVDLHKLTYYLNPDQKKLHTKGIKSIQSRVANLNELKFNINHEQICQTLIKSFFQYYNTQVQPEFFSINNIKNIPDFSNQLEKQSNWDWNFGSAPAFQHQIDTRFDWGGITLHFDIEQGIINRCQIFTDSLNPEYLEILAKKLIGTPYNTRSIQYCCDQWIHYASEKNQALLDTANWIIKNIV